MLRAILREAARQDAAAEWTFHNNSSGVRIYPWRFFCLPAPVDSGELQAVLAEDKLSGGGKVSACVMGEPGFNLWVIKI